MHLKEEDKKIEFRVEDLKNCLEDARWLWELHYDEIAQNKDIIPFDVDLEKYNRLADSGSLYVVTIRNDEKIVGYYVAIIMPHIRYKTSLTATTDIYYLHPDFRNAWVGLKLFKFVESDLKARGVERIIVTTKVKLDNSPIFERLGWSFTEKLFTKIIK